MQRFSVRKNNNKMYICSVWSKMTDKLFYALWVWFIVMEYTLCSVGVLATVQMARKMLVGEGKQSCMFWRFRKRTGVYVEYKKDNRYSEHLRGRRFFSPPWPSRVIDVVTRSTVRRWLSCTNCPFWFLDCPFFLHSFTVCIQMGIAYFSIILCIMISDYRQVQDTKGLYAGLQRGNSFLISSPVYTPPPTLW